MEPDLHNCILFLVLFVICPEPLFFFTFLFNSNIVYVDLYVIF